WSGYNYSNRLRPRTPAAAGVPGASRTGNARFAPHVSAVVAVAPGRRGDGRAHGDPRTGQNPCALARCEPRRQEAVLDLPRHRKAIECGSWKEEALVVLEPVRTRVDVAFESRDDPVVVLIDARNLGGVRIEEAPLEVRHGGFE